MSAVALATLGAGFLNSAGSVYTNAVNAANQYKINKDNIAMQYSINADQIEAARMNNETAINLANTAHQREVQDLRDAGLNPILSSNGSGSAVPSLDTPGLDAPQSAAPTAQNPLSGISSALGEAVRVNDQHNLDRARQAVLEGSIPDAEDSKPDGSGRIVVTPSSLKDKATAESSSAISEARAREAAAEVDAIESRLRARVMEEMYKDPKTRQLIKEGIESDLKDTSNKNWRNNLKLGLDAVNSAGSLIPGPGKMRILNKILK